MLIRLNTVNFDVHLFISQKNPNQALIFSSFQIMPRNYKRKNPDLKPVTEQQIETARKLIKDGKSQRSAANLVGISESCLRKRLKLDSVSLSMGRFKPTFDKQQELEFVSHCKKLDETHSGLTTNELRHLAYEYATVNKIEHRFDNTSRTAGRDWVENFVKRHPDLRRSRTISPLVVNQFMKNEIEIDETDPFRDNLTEKGLRNSPGPSGLKGKIAPKKMFFCLMCKKKYVDPPGEKWIQCIICEQCDSCDM